MQAARAGRVLGRWLSLQAGVRRPGPGRHGQIGDRGAVMFDGTDLTHWLTLHGLPSSSSRVRTCEANV